MNKRFSTKEQIDKLRDKAGTIAGDAKRGNDLVKTAMALLSKNKSTTELTQKVRLIGEMLTSYYRKEYVAVPWKTITLAVAGLLYFVIPTDFIPDFIPLAGWIDDGAVLTAIFKSLSVDLSNFKAWKTQQQSQVAVQESLEEEQ